jgi:general secretion pathway protein J
MRASRGFTLIEVILAMTLMAALLSLLFGAFRFAGRAWEAGESRAVTASHVRHALAFMQRDIQKAFAQRWREGNTPAARIAFEGGSDSLKFLVPKSGNPRSAGMTAIGFGIVDERNFADRKKRLAVWREQLDARATDFTTLDAAEPRALLENVAELKFEYYGRENDREEATWRDTWEPKQRLPQLVRIRITMAEPGYSPPEMVVQLLVGEESGCYINAFQRQCGAVR